MGGYTSQGSDSHYHLGVGRHETPLGWASCLARQVSCRIVGDIHCGYGYAAPLGTQHDDDTLAGLKELDIALYILSFMLSTSILTHWLPSTLSAYSS